MMKSLGIDIGGTGVKAGLVDRSGRVISERYEKTPHSVEAFSKLLHRLVEELGQEAEGIGIGCKGIIDPVSTLVIRQPGPLVFLEGVRLSDLTGSSLNITADNDARAAMLGEIMWGAARDTTNALMFTLGTGVGGAILSEGKIVRGEGGVAGHLGHVTIDPDGPSCICGNRGCLETAFSSKAIEAEAWRVINAGVDTALAHRPLSCQDVFDAAAEGDQVAAGIVNKAISLLAAAIAGLLHALDPEIVILGGQITQAGDALLDPLSAQIHQRSRALLCREVPIVLQQTKDPTGVAGAAALIFAEMM